MPRSTLLAVALAGAGAAACGPGLEATHENTLRFEHCYRLDMDVKIAPPHREHCWRDWTQTFADGQPLDRVEYARRRITQLESGDSRMLAIEGARPGARVFEELAPAGPAVPMAAPAPTSAHAPPPKTAPAPGSPEEAASARAEGARPGDQCATQCGSGLEGCTRLCETKQADCAVCREDYRRCMRRCFE